MTFPNLGAIVAIPYSANTGSKPSAMPIKLCTPISPQVGPSTLRIDIPWTQPPFNAGSAVRSVLVNVDLIAASLAGGGAPLDAVRFCKIDNSFNDVGVYVRFDDTQDVIFCPANSIIGAQVQSANQKMQIFGIGFFDGRAPTTSFYFSNAPQEPFALQGAIGTLVDGGMSEMKVSNGPAANFAVLNVGLGRAIANRRIALVVFSVASGVGARTVSGDIAGVPFTVDSFDLNNRVFMAIVSAIVPLGATGTVNLNFAGGTMDYCFFATFPMAKNDGSVPTFFNADIDVGGLLTREFSVNSIPGGFIVGGVGTSPAVASPPLLYGDLDLRSWNGTNVTAASFGALMRSTDRAAVYGESGSAVLAIGGGVYI